MSRSGTARSKTFGAWLDARIREAGMNNREFAKAVGVSHVSVGRWLDGRVPAAQYIDPIADVLLLDYDEVAERAGYRPVLPTDRLDRIHRRLDPYLLKLDNAHIDLLVRTARLYAEVSQPDTSDASDE